MANEDDKPRRKKIMVAEQGGWGSIYGLAFLGALVYYLSHASSFWVGVIGVFKSIFWPGVIVYKVLELLKE